MALTQNIQSYYHKTSKAAPLAVFRILFGLIMSFSMIRFWYKGWIEELYLAPNFHFHYHAFDFIQVPSAWATYLLFITCGFSAFLVSIGFKYRVSILTFFLSFGYIELMDKTTYLNHYYFVSLVAFVLIFLPAEVYYSVDAFRQKSKRAQFIPAWNIDVLKLLLAIVYIYAGLAKLNYDWMINAQPLSIWLSSKLDFPILGPLMGEKWMHYLFSWGGAFYDLFIVFFLLWKRSRILGFILVVLFHIVTWLLFPIGMFPFIMILSTLIFFEANFHEGLLRKISTIFSKAKQSIFNNGLNYDGKLKSKFIASFLTLFMLVQILLPLRHLLHSGNVFWDEKGYRFSWRVMLMEKTGYANFKIVDTLTNKRFYVQNQDFLSPLQEKQMSTQEDFIIEYGQYLGDHFEKQGHQNVAVYVESYASLNGRKSQIYFDPTIDIMKVKNGLFAKSNITALNE